MAVMKMRQMELQMTGCWIEPMGVIKALMMVMQMAVYLFVINVE